MSDGLYDVAIIGGGPAGSTAATLLAQAGRRVVVLEREKFPRFHIGESLLPFSTTTFDRLGVRAEMDRTFMPKYGGEIVAGCGTREAKFYFKNGFRSERDRAYQVTRSEFDQLLLNNSRAKGAEVREETTVQKIMLQEDRIRLEMAMPDGAEATLEARYLLDCSGRQTVVGNFLQLKKSYEHLQKFSIFAHFENVDRPNGIDGTLIRMVRGLDRWFWMIPLTPTRMSVGVVMDTVSFRALKLSPEAALEKCVNEQPLVAERMTKAERVTPVYSAGDYSYRNVRLYGERWLLAGDAAGFIDPVFSSGVYLAVMSGEKAADTLDQVLRDPFHKRKLLRTYERGINSVMNLYVRFVSSWYSGKEFMEVFMNPTDILQIAPAVNALLAGNAGQSFAVRWRMWLFYFFVRAQRFIPFSPRLSLVPAKADEVAPEIAPIPA
ncbi:MAG: tryptophan 7-halogenase [Chthoniobacterales bacterium]|nr:tryptophan 7-halogenase [Chthoniobacterales bacterium]